MWRVAGSAMKVGPARQKNGVSMLSHDELHCLETWIGEGDLKLDKE
jgi:hypothetical protein